MWCLFQSKDRDAAMRVLRELNCNNIKVPANETQQRPLLYLLRKKKNPRQLRKKKNLRQLRKKKNL